ncbi:hypothetical protein H0H93_014740 [Arthromyces matolae]|nr:hypothetical protein H0H93_014740 [Arthromyces matolae]
MENTIATMPFAFSELTDVLSPSPTAGNMMSRSTWGGINDMPVTPTPAYSQAYQQIGAYQIIRDASHQALITADNKAYTQLYEKNLQTEARMKGLQDAYDRLLERVGSPIASNSLGSLSSPRPRLNRSDYPRVTIWYSSDWQNHAKKRGDSTTGFHQPSVSRKKDHSQDDKPRDSLYYIQSEDGTPISQRKAFDVCHHARKIWEYMRDKDMAPPTWGHCSAPAREYYLAEMYKFCPDLMLGDGDWKADRLATDNYTGWKRSYREKIKAKVEEPVVKVEGKTGGIVSEHKRKASPSTNMPIKPEKAPRLTAPNNSIDIPSTLVTTCIDLELGLSSELTKVSEDQLLLVNGVKSTSGKNGYCAKMGAHALLGATPVSDNLEVVSTDSMTTKSTTPIVVDEDRVVDVAVVEDSAFLGTKNDDKTCLTETEGSNNNSNEVTFIPAGTQIKNTRHDTNEDAASASATCAAMEVEKVADDLRVPEPDSHPLQPLKKQEAVSRIVGLKTASTKPSNGPVNAVAPKKRAEMFKYQSISCSPLNLFGKDYIDKHGPSTKAAVVLAFEALSKEQRNEYDAQRKRLLDARKGSDNKKQTPKAKGNKSAGNTVGLAGGNDDVSSVVPKA